MRLFGLIGYPLGHSFSQQYFSEKFARAGISDARYELFPLPDLANLPDLLRQRPELCGLNVTIPHKRAVLPYLHALDDTARAVGAVNCIRIREGRLRGFNTDAVGFGRSLRAVLGEQRAARQALVLGTGGAARAVAWALGQMGIAHRFVSRQPSGADQISYEAVSSLLPSDYGLIVNATPLGTYPNTEECPPIPFDWLLPEHLVYDLVYNPPETLLLRRAAERGCAVKNGLEMLHVQAEAAWEIFSF
jgi:shikimate dehydrogenase